MLKFGSLKKKFLAAVTAAALSVPLIFASPATVEAASGSLIGAGLVILQGAQATSQLNEKLKYYDTTEQGRQEMYDSLRKQYGVNEDPELNARLAKIMANLTKGVAAVDPTIKSKPYLYFVADQESINAACAMGHVMMVNAGTLKKISNEDEIAAIVGHEMGHGQRSHAVKGNKKRLQKALTASVAASAVGGGQLASTIAGLALNHSVAHGDRKYETEADLLSFEYMTHTDYNPGACAAIMQKFVDMSLGTKRSSVAAFFNPSDHPDSEKRRDAYVKKLYEYSKNHATAKNGIVTVNNKTFMKVAASDDMSSAERSYFILGNLATAYHRGQNKYAATVENGIVMLGNRPIVQPIDGDEDAQTLADRLNAIK